MHDYSILRQNIVIIFCQKDILRISLTWIEHVWLELYGAILYILSAKLKKHNQRRPASQFGNFNSNRHFLVPLFRNLVMWNLLLAIIRCQADWCRGDLVAWEFHLGDREWEEAWPDAWSQNDIIINPENAEIPVKWRRCIPHKLAFDLLKILICFLSLRMLALDWREFVKRRSKVPQRDACRVYTSEGKN